MELAVEVHDTGTNNTTKAINKPYVIKILGDYRQSPTLSATGLWAIPDIQHCQSGLRARAARHSDR